jgi:hypothetical protein
VLNNPHDHRLKSKNGASVHANGSPAYGEPGLGMSSPQP